MKKILIIFIAIVFIIGGYFLWLKVISPRIKQEVNVTVDTTQKGRDLSKTLKGIDGIIYDSDFEGRAKEGIKITGRNWNYFKNDINFSNTTVRLWLFADWTKPEHLDIPLQDLKKAGAEVVMLIYNTPKELSSQPDAKIKKADGVEMPGHGAYPPTDYNKWADLVYDTVHYWNVEKKYGVKYFEIWNEPDSETFWRGTDEELFELYKVSAQAVKKADPSAKVGGLANACWMGCQPKDKDPEEGLTFKFIQYVKENNLPLDFVSWHSYGQGEEEKSIPTIKKWLSDAGYPNATTIIDEWGFQAAESTISGRDTEYNAAYIANRIIRFAKNNLDRQSHFLLNNLDYEKFTGAEFDGNFGLFTQSGVIKASYNALKMISMMAKDEVKVESDEEQIQALATSDKEKTTILLTNFQFKEGGGRIKKIQNFFESKIRPAQVNLKIEGLEKSQTYHLERYLIDSSHSNAYKIKKKISAKINDAKKDALSTAKNYLLSKGVSESEIKRLIELYQNNPESIKEEFKSSPEEKQQIYLEALKIYQDTKYKTIEEINQWSEVKLAKVEDKEITGQELINQELTLEPYATTLIVLTASQ